MRKFFKITFIIATVVVAAGYLIPERKAMPCCTPSDYNHQSFWHWPWTRGENGHPHTGIDIFGRVGTPVVSQTGGLVIYADDMPGKTLLVVNCLHIGFDDPDAFTGPEEQILEEFRRVRDEINDVTHNRPTLFCPKLCVTVPFSPLNERFWAPSRNFLPEILRDGPVFALE